MNLSPTSKLGYLSFKDEELDGLCCVIYLISSTVTFENYVAFPVIYLLVLTGFIKGVS